MGGDPSDVIGIIGCCEHPRFMRRLCSIGHPSRNGKHPRHGELVAIIANVEHGPQ